MMRFSKSLIGVARAAAIMSIAGITGGGISTVYAEPSVPIQPTTSIAAKGVYKGGKSGKEIHIDVNNPFYTFDEKNDIVNIDSSQYERIDLEYMKLEKFRMFQKGNALHDTLSGNSMLERYEIYKKLPESLSSSSEAKADGGERDDSCDEIVAVVRFGNMINGHPSVVHGGITSLVFDNTFGWLFFSLNLPLAVTANLNINYRSPLPMNTTCILKARLERLEGRKMFMNATLHDLHGKRIADSTSLFIALKPLQAAAVQVQMKVNEIMK
jgi:acyl-coenzyme A thioesterase PaaI-like protein